MLVERGLTLGKFLPLHQGHALLLESAAAHCAELVVLIGTTPQDPYSFDLRRRWILELLRPQLEATSLELHIHPDPDVEPPYAAAAKDEQGTVTDERYWRTWLAQNARYLKGTDLVFSSDVYGAELARRIGARWFPVDPERETVPITAAEIRGDPRRNFGFVSAVAKAEVGLTVAVVGAESTGKSTLVKALALHYGTRYAPEWGRIISEAQTHLDSADFNAIVDMQCRLIATAQQAGSGICFTDTEAVTTALFAPVYLGRELDYAWDVARQQRFALYLVLAPTVPWVDDGTRILEQSERLRFHEALLEALMRLGKPHTVIDAPAFPERVAAARRAVNQLLERSGL